MIVIKKKIKAFIFDMDGTILKTEHIWNQATKDFLARRGFHSLQEEHHKLIASFNGKGIEEPCSALKKVFALSESVEEIIVEKQAIMADRLAEGVNFVDGFLSFFDDIERHEMPRCIATNADSESLKVVSKSMNLSRFFGKHIYNVSHVNNVPKPSPDLFLHAAKQLGADPKECIVFEDSLVGFTAAKAAGMKCIGIKTGGNDDHLYLVDESIDSYNDALEKLRRVVR